MAGHSYFKTGTAAAGNGTSVDILGEGNFTARQLLIVNLDAALLLTVRGLGMYNDVIVGPKTVYRLVGSYRELSIIEATASAQFVVMASDSATPALSMTNIT